MSSFTLNFASTGIPQKFPWSCCNLHFNFYAGEYSNLSNCCIFSVISPIIVKCWEAIMAILLFRFSWMRIVFSIRLMHQISCSCLETVSPFLIQLTYSFLPFVCFIIFLYIFLLSTLPHSFSSFESCFTCKKKMNCEN